MVQKVVPDVNNDDEESGAMPTVGGVNMVALTSVVGLTVAFAFGMGA